MAEENKTTLEKIYEAARREFAEKGFKSSSLRNIVNTAGVTTGAFYGYFSSKEELFDSIVSEKYETFLNMFRQAQKTFTELDPEDQADNIGVISGNCLLEMMKYAFKFKEEFRLILCSSQGTKYENIIDDMVRIEIDATHAFARVMETLGHPKYNVDPFLEHILVSGLFTAFFELIIHDTKADKAEECLNELRDFYTAGWKKIMGF